METCRNFRKLSPRPLDCSARLFGFFCAMGIALAPLTAQDSSDQGSSPIIGGEVDVFSALQWNPSEDSPRASFSGSVLSSIEVAQRLVKLELGFKFLPALEQGRGSQALIPISLHRAAIKARFPLNKEGDEPYYLRATLGKSRLAWGEGFAFNAGDLLGSSTSPLGSLQGANLRDDSYWMLALNFPLGRFSFLELVAQAADPQFDLNALTGSLEARPIDRSSAGLRLFLQAGTVKIEGGGLYKGSTFFADTLEGLRSLRAYLGLKTALGPIEWYWQNSLTWLITPQSQLSTWDESKRYLSSSTGFWWQFKVGLEASMSLRLEAILSPFALWDEQNFASLPLGSIHSQPLYALYLYGEWSSSYRQVSFYLRSLFSPADVSALVLAGFDWKPYQGFTLYMNFSIALGDENDSFRLQSPSLPVNQSPAALASGLSLGLGMRYSF